MSFHFPTKKSQILLDFRPNPGEPSLEMKYQYFSNIIFMMFWADIARFLQYFRNLSNSFINMLAILQDFNGIFLKYSLNITVLCGYNLWIISVWIIITVKTLKMVCYDYQNFTKLNLLWKHFMYTYLYSLCLIVCW